MTKFSLLSGLTQNAKEKAAVDPNAPNITYQEYELDVHGTETKVLIPERACEEFEAAVMEAGELSTLKLKKLVREHRGILPR